MSETHFHICFNGFVHGLFDSVAKGNSEIAYVLLLLLKIPHYGKLFKSITHFPHELIAASTYQPKKTSS